MQTPISIIFIVGLITLLLVLINKSATKVHSFNEKLNKDVQQDDVVFICIAPIKTNKDVNQTPIGTEPQRVLCFHKPIGTRRIYRQQFGNTLEDMELFTFKSQTAAQSLCDEVNEAYNDDFAVQLYNTTTKQLL